MATARPVEGLDALAGVHGIRTEDQRLHFEVDGDNLEAVITTWVDSASAAS